MATATTPETIEAQVEFPAGQVNTPAPRRAWVNIDTGVATIISLAAVAIAAFTYLNIRIDSVATELRGEVRTVNTKVDRLDEKLDRTNERIEKLAARTDEKLDRINERFDRLSAETNDKFDRINERFDRLSAETNDKFDRMNEKLTQILINQSQSK